MARRFWIIVLAATFATGCATMPSRKPIIRIVGSDTMLPLNQVLASAYEKQMPEISISCQGGGTASGMRALLEGKADICAASRPIAHQEVRALAEKYHSIGMAHFICRDAVEIILHPDNPVTSLQRAQVKAIFSGQITNWRQVGGADQLIQVFIRTQSSGTRRYFSEHLLQDIDYSAKAIEVETNADMMHRIANAPSGIGYGGNAYIEGVKVCKLDAVAPVLEKVGANAYPLSRYLYFYTIHETYGPLKEFIDWVISPDAQPLIEQSGYFPIWRPY